MNVLYVLLSVATGAAIAAVILYFFVIRNLVSRQDVELARMRGREEGIREGQGRFGVTCEGYVEEESNFFVSYVEAGIYSQITLNGFPIGDRTKRVLSMRKKSNDENMAKMVGEVRAALDHAVDSFARHGVLAQVLPDVSRKTRK